MADLNESAEVENWLPNEFVSELCATLLHVPDEFRTEFEAVCNNARKANQKLVETLRNLTFTDEQIVSNNVYSDDRITEFFFDKYEQPKPDANLTADCSSVENTQLTVDECNVKARKCVNDFKQNLYPMLDDINTRIAETCKFNQHIILRLRLAESIQDEKNKLQRLADDIDTGVIMAAPKEAEYFDDFKKCLVDVMTETEGKLATIFADLNKISDNNAVTDINTTADVAKINGEMVAPVNTIANTNGKPDDNKI